MKKIYFFLSAVIVSTIMAAQVIPSNMQVQWTGAGIPANNPTITNEINVMSFGAYGDSIHNDAAAITSAISSLAGRAGIVYFPPGKYLIESTLNLPDSVTLRGDCNDSSKLIFNLGGAAVDCIDAQVTETDSFQTINAGFSKDTNVVVVDSTNGYNVGDYAEIEETNGAWNVVPATWALDCVGQIVHITAISGNKITFENPLRLTYTPSLMPRIRKWTPLVFIGIEDLNITRVDAGLPATGYQISFENAMNCWVKGVESSHSIGAHVAMTTCTNITISGCYFHSAYAYDGSGTRGYGVMMIQHAGQCLVENNVFDSLRHSVIVKQGANGNVAGYNYAINEYRTETPNDGGADLVCHGHYSFANLFESNIVHMIQVDSTWGPTGPYTTFYRNRANSYGIIMTPGASVMSDSLNWVGNETTDNSILHGLFYLAGINHYEYGNNILGTITPTGTTNLTDTSYYRTTFTDFFSASPYPPTIGIPNILDSGTIPAMQRYLVAGRITVSPNPPCNTATLSPAINFQNTANIYLVPASNSFIIRFNSRTVTAVKIYSADGRLIYNNTINPNINLTEINTTDFPPGIYLVQLVNSSPTIVKKLVVER